MTPARWIVAFVIAAAALETVLQLHDRLRHWHRTPVSLLRRAGIYAVFVLGLMAFVYVQRSGERERKNPPPGPNGGSGNTSTASTTDTATTTSTGTTATETTGTKTTTAITMTETTDTQAKRESQEARKAAWERLERGLVLRARQQPPDYEEVIGPDQVSNAINVQEHRMRIFAFDLSGNAEGYWFGSGTEQDMVVFPCARKEGWQTCTPPTEAEHPPKFMRIHNLDRHSQLVMKLWFVPYADPGGSQ
jgi:hypothetical protein